MRPPVTTWLRGSTTPLSDDHDVALLDLDGVVYVGAEAVPGVPDALAEARSRGMRLAFVTNNAARSPHAVADHLSDLGVAARSSEVITSAQAAARYLSEHLPGGAHVLVVGTTGLYEALQERGLKPVPDASGQVDAVVQGYSPKLDWSLLAEGCIGINRGVLWVATNTDATVPSARGPLPGNGSMVAALQTATRRRPIVTGKPDPTMHRETMLRTGAETPIVVGDRLDTDIEGANAVGCASLLVFSGVATVADLLGAAERRRPSFLAADAAGLLHEHPQPQWTATTASCGRWRVEIDDEALVLSGGPAPDSAVGATPAPESAGYDADTLDAVRALCLAGWAVTDRGGRHVDGADCPAPAVRAQGDDAASLLERCGLSDRPAD